MLSKNLDAIEVADLQALVANGVSERQTIDYKSQLPGKTDADKKEFLADVFSFATTAAGDLLYGLREECCSDRNPRSRGSQTSTL